MGDAKVGVELYRLAHRFRSYAKAAREQAEEARPRTKARTGWTARAEVWELAALEAENAGASLVARKR